MARSVFDEPWEVEPAKDYALRQLEHLRREIDYGYPAPTIRSTRRAADHAVVVYCRALDAKNKRLRGEASGG